MHKMKLLHCINYTKLLVDCMHGLIHDIQDINPELAFSAIEAQMLLMRTQLMLKSLINKEKSVIDKES